MYTGFQQRFRKIYGPDFLRLLLAEIERPDAFSLRGFHQRFQLFTDVDLAISSLYDRFGPALKETLRLLLEDLGQDTPPTPLHRILRDLVAIDASILALPRSCETSGPAPGARHPPP